MLFGFQLIFVAEAVPRISRSGRHGSSFLMYIQHESLPHLVHQADDSVALVLTRKLYNVTHQNARSLKSSPSSLPAFSPRLDMAWSSLILNCASAAHSAFCLAAHARRQAGTQLLSTGWACGLPGLCRSNQDPGAWAWWASKWPVDKTSLFQVVCGEINGLSGCWDGFFCMVGGYSDGVLSYGSWLGTGDT